MDPITLQIFNKLTTPPRMVYALAAKESVVCVSMPAARSRANSYTSFDIWCGQATSKTFGTIRCEDDDVYKELLRLSRARDVPNMFNPKEKSLKEPCTEHVSSRIDTAWLLELVL